MDKDKVMCRYADKEMRRFYAHYTVYKRPQSHNLRPEKVMLNY